MEITIKIDGRDTPVEVSVEVYEYLDKAKHKEENLAHEQRRHWDGRECDEYIISTEDRAPQPETPEESVCRSELLDLIYSALDTCTEEQRKRFLLYAIYGLSYSEIGEICGCTKIAVFQSVEAVRRKCKNF